jgi:exodeoxyribonuclease VII large subunit
VISAVGHETDFTIADFAADLRAPTPSAAAELAVPEMDACYEAVRLQSDRMTRALNARLERMRANVKLFASAKAFRLLERKVENRRQSLDLLREQALRGMQTNLQHAKAELSQSMVKLQALDPSAVLNRGYAIVTDRAGETLSGVSGLHPQDGVRIRMRDGTADAVIERVE